MCARSAHRQRTAEQVADTLGQRVIAGAVQDRKIDVQRRNPNPAHRLEQIELAQVVAVVRVERAARFVPGVLQELRVQCRVVARRRGELRVQRGRIGRCHLGGVLTGELGLFVVVVERCDDRVGQDDRSDQHQKHRDEPIDPHPAGAMPAPTALGWPSRSGVELHLQGGGHSSPPGSGGGEGVDDLPTTLMGAAWKARGGSFACRCQTGGAFTPWFSAHQSGLGGPRLETCQTSCSISRRRAPTR